MRTVANLLLAACLFAGSAAPAFAEESTETVLIHLKTGLTEDDAQLCVAYNQIWAAAETSARIKVLVDASAVGTYKKNWLGNNRLENYKIPLRLRKILATEFEMPLARVPSTYGEYLEMLHKKGVEFYVNSEMLVTSGIEENYGEAKNLAVDFFKPVGIKEELALIASADTYMAF